MNRRAGIREYIIVPWPSPYSGQDVSHNSTEKLYIFHLILSSRCDITKIAFDSRTVSYDITTLAYNITSVACVGAQWLSGRVLDLRLCCVLEQDTFILA